MVDIKTHFSLNDAARLAGVTYQKLWYHLATGRLPEPARVGRARVFDAADIAAIKEFFAARDQRPAGEPGRGGEPVRRDNPEEVER